MAYHYKLGGRARQRLRSDRLGARAAQASVSGPPRGLSPEGPRPGPLQWPLAGFASLRTLGLRAALSRGPLARGRPQRPAPWASAASVREHRGAAQAREASVPVFGASSRGRCPTACSVPSRRVAESGSHSGVGGRFAETRASGGGGGRSGLPQ